MVFSGTPIISLNLATVSGDFSPPSLNKARKMRSGFFSFSRLGGLGISLGRILCTIANATGKCLQLLRKHLQSSRVEYNVFLCRPNTKIRFSQSLDPLKRSPTISEPREHSSTERSYAGS